MKKIKHIADSEPSTTQAPPKRRQENRVNLSREALEIAEEIAAAECLTSKTEAIEMVLRKYRRDFLQ